MENTNIYKQVIDFCHENIAHEGPVMDYLRGRYISDDMISKYKLGAWPNNLYTLLNSVAPDGMREAHLLWNDNNFGLEVGKFRNHRLLMPIYDVYGDPVGIMGRCISDDWKERGIPKYENTRFSKRHHLFGLNIAREYIRSDNKVLITEGTLDVIKAKQHGINNVVAVLGANLTKEHIILLCRYTNNIFLCFDNDEAGAKAILRANRFKYDGLNMFEKRVPTHSKDLDEYLDKKYHIMSE